MNTPAYLDVRPDTIPTKMCQVPRWVCWTAEQRGDRWTKVPRTPAGAGASSTDPATWGAFEAVLSAYRAGRCAGIGWVLCPPFAGCDFDHVIGADGSLDADTAAWVARFGSYTECSVSGTGLHVIVTSDLPAFGKRQGPRESYSGGRYFTVSGRRWPGTPGTVVDRPDVLRSFLATLGEDRPERATATPIRPVAPTGRYAQLGPRTLGYLNSVGPNGYPSASEADAAAAAALIASGHTEGEALALMLDSPRGRDALERKGRHGDAYLARTVQHAAAFVGPVMEHNSGLRAHRVPVRRPTAIRIAVGRPS